MSELGNTTRRKLRPGMRIRAQDYNSIVDGLNAALRATATGAGLSVDSSGIAIKGAAPRATSSVRLVRIDELETRVIKVRVITATETGFTVAENTIDAVKPPGYSNDHYEFYLEDNSQFGLLIGGFVFPHYRMKLVDPAPLADLCEPCTVGE